MAVFETEYSIQLHYLKGLAVFVREEELPFNRLLGLKIIDVVIGKFTLEHMVRHNGSGIFLWQATVNRESWSLAVEKRTSKKVG